MSPKILHKTGLFSWCVRQDSRAQEALNNAPEGDGTTHGSSPSPFYAFIQAFLPMPDKTLSNQMARSASVSFDAKPSVSLALYPSVIENALTCRIEKPCLGAVRSPDWWYMSNRHFYHSFNLFSRQQATAHGPLSFQSHTGKHFQKSESDLPPVYQRPLFRSFFCSLPQGSFCPLWPFVWSL